jgi:sigma-E factor negative regulatory protein RseB
MKRWLVTLLLASLSGSPHAENSQSLDPSAWAQRISSSAHQLNYVGTFVYQHGDQVETSRIVHRVDESGEQEKLETLDGPPREIIRINDQVLCYLPGNKGVRVEKRHAQKSFPALLPKQLEGMVERYNIKLGEQERIAGYDCQVVILEPRDGYRYGHKFWADMSSGLMLKAVTLNEKGQIVDQFAFTQIAIGGQIDRSLIRSRYAGQKLFHHPEPAAHKEAPSADSGWTIKDAPQGFKKIMEKARSMPGRKVPVMHMVLSDGLVAVSVFIEPLAGMSNKPMDGAFNQGSINVYAKPVAGNQVTVLGEVPAATVLQVANSLVFQGKK